MLHGGNIYGFSEEEKNKLLDFSANISPLGMPEGIRDAIISEITMALHYPDPRSRRLREAISEKIKVNKDWIICGNGAADLVYRLIYSMKPKKALIVHPTFVEYEEALSCVGTEIEGYDLNHETFEIGEDFLEKLDETIDILFICNPNNPTGVITKKDLLEKILEKAYACHTMLVMDECFLDFTGNENRYSMIDLLNQYSNLLILKSFTKMFAIPGVRLGYALCSNEKIIENMYHAGQSWSVSTIAVSAGVMAMNEADYVKAVVAYVNQEREFLETELTKLQIRWIRGHANYMLIQCGQIPDLFEKLLKKNIMIRTCGNYKNLGNDYYRIAINSHEANVYLVKALEEIMRDEV